MVHMWSEGEVVEMEDVAADFVGTHEAVGPYCYVPSQQPATASNQLDASQRGPPGPALEEPGQAEAAAPSEADQPEAAGPGQPPHEEAADPGEHPAVPPQEEPAGPGQPPAVPVDHWSVVNSLN